MKLSRIIAMKRLRKINETMSMKVTKYMMAPELPHI